MLLAAADIIVDFEAKSKAAEGVESSRGRGIEKEGRGEEKSCRDYAEKTACSAQSSSNKCLRFEALFVGIARSFCASAE